METLVSICNLMSLAFHPSFCEPDEKNKVMQSKLELQALSFRDFFSLISDDLAVFNS